jgi:hypothetical protein
VSHTEKLREAIGTLRRVATHAADCSSLYAEVVELCDVGHPDARHGSLDHDAIANRIRALKAEANAATAVLGAHLRRDRNEKWHERLEDEAWLDAGDWAERCHQLHGEAKALYLRSHQASLRLDEPTTEPS